MFVGHICSSQKANKTHNMYFHKPNYLQESYLHSFIWSEPFERPFTRFSSRRKILRRSHRISTESRPYGTAPERKGERERMQPSVAVTILPTVREHAAAPDATASETAPRTPRLRQRHVSHRPRLHQLPMYIIRQPQRKPVEISNRLNQRMTGRVRPRDKNTGQTPAG